MENSRPSHIQQTSVNDDTKKQQEQAVLAMQEHLKHIRLSFHEKKSSQPHDKLMPNGIYCEGL